MTQPPTVGDSRAERIPWEERGTLGLGRAFARTLVFSVREPKRFFALVPRDGSPLPALVYGFLFEIPVALLTFVYQKAIGEPELRETLAGITPALRGVMPGAPELVERALGSSALVTLLLAPLSYLFELVVTTGVTWVGLRLTRNLRTSFGALLRLFAYASSVRVLGLLGVTGDVFLSGLSFLAILGIGSYYWLVLVRGSQQIDTRRAVYASLAGGLVATALGCIVGVPLVVGLIVWVVSKVDLPKLSP